MNFQSLRVRWYYIIREVVDIEEDYKSFSLGDKLKAVEADIQEKNQAHPHARGLNTFFHKKSMIGHILVANVSQYSLYLKTLQGCQQVRFHVKM